MNISEIYRKIHQKINDPYRPNESYEDTLLFTINEDEAVFLSYYLTELPDDISKEDENSLMELMKEYITDSGYKFPIDEILYYELHSRLCTTLSVIVLLKQGLVKISDIKDGEWLLTTTESEEKLHKENYSSSISNYGEIKQ